jgi:predicted RNA-binding Zn-ribbon protein involved in translation (DUF1610 family)
MEETDRKCPSCGGVMNFDPATGGLYCPYCEYRETIAMADERAMAENRAERGPTAAGNRSTAGGQNAGYRVGNEAAEELDFAQAESRENCDWGVATKTVICKSCSAESIYDQLQISGVCPFCGSNQVMEAADRNTMAPGGVIPFQVTDKSASDLFTKWIKRKWFCPKLAKESAKANHFKGVYLPYWTFDADTFSQYQARYGKNRVVRRNGERKVVTDWYSTSGTYHQAIDDELVAATTNHSQSMLRGLEPFNTAANKRYRPEYIAGFVAERYAVGIKEAWQYAQQSIRYKLEDGVERVVRAEKNADTVSDVDLSTMYSNVTYKYLLLPIWISNYKYKDKIYNFMVNGQTGKVAGKSPISAVKVAITVVAALAAAALIAWLRMD